MFTETVLIVQTKSDHDLGHHHARGWQTLVRVVLRAQFGRVLFHRGRKTASLAVAVDPRRPLHGPNHLRAIRPDHTGGLGAVALWLLQNSLVRSETR